MTVVKTELKAKDVMTPEPVCVTPSTTIRQLARLLQEHEISGAPVVDEEGRVVGVVSKTDLIGRCVEGTIEIPPAYLFEMLSEQEYEGGASEVPPSEPQVSVQDFMTEDPVMVAPDLSVTAVARLMFEGRIHRVIVVDDEKFPVGIITSIDLLGSFAR